MVEMRVEISQTAASFLVCFVDSIHCDGPTDTSEDVLGEGFENFIDQRPPDGVMFETPPVCYGDESITEVQSICIL